MLKVILLEKATDLYSLDFLQNSDIPTNLVLPSPSLADDLRERFLDKDVDLITISKFVDSELNEETEDKAHLIFDLLRCYKKNFKKPSFEKFLHCFNHFTDLRSFTLDHSLIEEVLPEFDEEVAQGLTLFWQELNSKSLIDEHSSYFKLSEKFKDLNEVPLSKNIIFYGFNHLSAIQIDLIQSLSKHYNIYIPVLKRVYTQCHNSDWIKWIDSSFSYSEEESNPPNAQGKLAFYPKNKMSEYLSVCPIRNKDRKVDFYFLSKELSFNQVNEIPLSGLQFKVKNDLFLEKIKKLFKVLDGKDVKSYIKSQIDQELKKDFDSKDFRLLKVLYLIRDNLLYFGENLDRFDLNALEYVISLELPRTYSTPIFPIDSIGEIKGRGSLISFNPENLNIILASSEDSSIKVGGAKYPKKVEEFLRALGPIQNHYLEFLNTREILRDIFQDPNTFLLTEDGSDKTDEAIKEIISKLNITNQLEVSFSVEYQDPKDHLDKYIVKIEEAQKTLSSSKLQSFVDCKRQFYFKYIKKIPSPESPTNSFSSSQLGTIHHSVIAAYLEKNESLNQEIFEQIANSEIDRFITENKMNPNPTDKEKALIEVKDYSLNGIEEILKLKKIFTNCQFGFEKELGTQEGPKITGRLDIVITADEGYGVIDFKRTGSGIPTKGKLMDFQKIQPWFYLNHYPTGDKPCLFVGYLNLSKPDESLIYCSEQSVVDRLKEGEFLNGENIYTFKNEEDKISVKLPQYAVFETDQFQKMNLENQFLANPIDLDVCRFCVVNQICPKDGGLNEST